MPGRYSADDYAAAMRALAPQGRVWPAEQDAVQSQAITALAGTWARIDEAAVDLLADAFPASTEQLLPEWESSLGLPDACAGTGQTDDQRRAQVRARFIGIGGQSRARFIAFAATLGFGISITVYAPFRIGLNHAGDAVAGAEVAFLWGVKINTNTGGLDAAVLLCELSRIKPAETIIFLTS